MYRTVKALDTEKTYVFAAFDKEEVGLLGSAAMVRGIAKEARAGYCSMVNLDPDSADRAPEVMKAVVRANQNNAGIYGAVTRIGRLAVGQTIFLRAATEKRERG
jgi:Zn-dependent M28 family amino/carboxypeptidase